MMMMKLGMTGGALGLGGGVGAHWRDDEKGLMQQPKY